MSGGRAQSQTMAIRGSVGAALLILFMHHGYCYEKTLRKIVRDQYKMVQTPFSVIGVGDMVWKNMSIHPFRTDPISLAHSKKVLRHSQGPKTSFGDMSKARYSMMHLGNKEIVTNDRLIRTPLLNVTTPSDNSLYAKQYYESDDRFSDADSHDGYFQARKANNNFSYVHRVLEAVKGKDQVSRSEDKISKVDKSSFKSTKNKATNPPPQYIDEVEDVLAEETGVRRYSYNKSVHPYSCVVLREVNADIDVQEKFSQLNIEPKWCYRRTFWNRVFENRYKSLMKDPKWPHLKVILIPRSHVDSIWKRTFEQYHSESVNKILSNMVKKLQFYSNLTFSWNEVSHLSRWWASTTHKNRLAFRRLVKAGRLEITTGFWVEPDEATSHIFELVHQMIEGHQWLKQNLNISPKVGWLTNSVTHSPTMPYLLAASGVPYLVFTNIHFVFEKHFAEYQYSDFVWLQNWDNDETDSTLNDGLNKIGIDRLPKSAVLAHYLQFNAAGFKACGPNKTICMSEFNFARSNRNTNVHSYNERQKAELLLEQYSMSGSISPHNVVIAPVGGPFRYEGQAEFDYQYNNYLRLAQYINAHPKEYKASVTFGTAQDYFNTILDKHKTYPTLKGDFLNFADLQDGSPAYWTGYFTTRPLLKLLLRQMQATLRSTEILFSFALTYNSFEDTNVTFVIDLLEKARAAAARLSDKNVVGGTLTVNALRYVHTQILNTVKDCWYIQEVAASSLSIKPGHKAPYLQKYVYRDGEFVSAFRSVGPGDQMYVFNSLSHERTEVVELLTKHPNIRIVDHNKKEVMLQLNPTWKYGPDNVLLISNKYFKVVFAVVVPPLTLELFRVTESYGGSLTAAAAVYCDACTLEPPAPSAAASPFTLHPIKPGDIQIESYKYRLIFDELTGFMKTVVEKDTNMENSVIMDYGAFHSSDRNSGMYLFKANSSCPLYNIFKRNFKIVIVNGQVTTELTSVHGRLLQHTAKIFNLMNCPLSSAIYLESRVDYEASPKHREMELFLSIHTDITNGNPPELVTDNNGFQYTARTLNLSRGVESNLYPMTSLAFIEDHAARVTVAGEHAGGVGALHEGQLLLLLDRRVLYDDGRGVGEGLADSRPVTHRHYILLENLDEPYEHLAHLTSQKKLRLPSLAAVQLSNALTNHLDVFIVDKNATDLPYYSFLPLINVPFPCDVSVINFRAMLRHRTQRSIAPNTALLVLHRQSFACGIKNAVLHCDGEVKFIVEKILRNVKSVYKTNLSGTSKGVVVNKINQAIFPPMELATFRLHF